MSLLLSDWVDRVWGMPAQVGGGDAVGEEHATPSGEKETVKRRGGAWWVVALLDTTRWRLLLRWWGTATELTTNWFCLFSLRNSTVMCVTFLRTHHSIRRPLFLVRSVCAPDQWYYYTFFSLGHFGWTLGEYDVERLKYVDSRHYVMYVANKQ